MTLKPKNFDHNKFKRQVADLLDKYESSGLDRAWEIAQGYMKVVAAVDRRDDETLASSTRHAWFDLWQMFNGVDATFTYWGMYEEMRHSVGEQRADELTADIVAIGESCMKGAKRSRPRRSGSLPQPKLKKTQHPHLKVVQ